MKYDLVSGSLDQNVDEVIYDSRKARPDSVFVCIQGSTRDSHEFISPDVTVIRVVEADLWLGAGGAFCGAKFLW